VKTTVIHQFPIVNVMVIIISTILVAIITSLLGFNVNQIISVVIFVFKTTAALMFWRYRLPFAILGLSVLLLVGVIDVTHLIEFASFDIVLFLVGMMIIIGFLEERAFFEYLSQKFMKMAGGSVHKTIITLMIFAAFSAALVDEVTSILFTTSLILRMTDKLKVKPIPLIMIAVFSTNIGSAATAVGNPVGVMIAFKGGFSFLDFLRWSTPICVVALLITMIICLKYFSSYISKFGYALKHQKELLTNVETNIITPKNLVVCWLVFLSTVGLLIVHHPLEEVLQLEKNTLLLGTPLLMASLVLFSDLGEAKNLVERRVDWWTLLFFIMLFASVGTLQYTGVIKILAEGLIQISGRAPLKLLLLFTPTVGFLSAFLDNVLAVATFSPVIIEIGEAGIYVFPIWWGMLFAACFFGNMTIIGSTANLVAAGILERRGEHLSLLEWIKIGFILSFSTTMVAILLLYIQLPL